MSRNKLIFVVVAVISGFPLGQAGLLWKPDPSHHVAVLLPVLPSLVHDVLGKVKEAPAHAANDLLNTVNQATNIVNSVVDNVGSAAAGVADELSKDVGLGVDAVQDIINDPLGEVQGAANAAVDHALSDASNAVNAVGDAVSSSVNDAVAAVGGVAGHVEDDVRDAVNSVKDTVKPALDNIKSSFEKFKATLAEIRHKLMCFNLRNWESAWSKISGSNSAFEKFHQRVNDKLSQRCNAAA